MSGPALSAEEDEEGTRGAASVRTADRDELPSSSSSSLSSSWLLLSPLILRDSTAEASGMGMVEVEVEVPLSSRGMPDWDGIGGGGEGETCRSGVVTGEASLCVCWSSCMGVRFDSDGSLAGVCVGVVCDDAEGC